MRRYSPLMEALLTLLGVAVGAGASVVTTWLTLRGTARTEREREDLKWERDRSIRWEERFVAAVFDFSSAVKSQSRTALRVAASKWPELSTNPLDEQRGFISLGELEDNRSIHFERLLILLGKDEIVDRAREWQHVVWEMHRVAEPGSAVDRAAFDTLLRRAGAARDAFNEAVRLRLEV